MLTSYCNLDSAFCNPASRSSTPPATDDPQDHLWLGTGLKDLCWRSEDCPQTKDCAKAAAFSPKSARTAMEPRIDPEEDLQRLIDNDLKLRLSGYYYGYLSWLDASHLLKRSKVGTFLVRDSEHPCYLYALTVQTRRGPTSCRIEYHDGRFRLDSSAELADKMPRFGHVVELVEHYVQLTHNLPRKSGGAGKEMAPVWLAMDVENSLDVPVQIYAPLYKGVRSLQHLCRVTLVKSQSEKHPQSPFSRTLDEYTFLPTVLKDFLREYPYSQ